ncbi:hypothetical protein [Legionella quateirensis]|uniref:Uncharacterized protein n=1 Tax=Legionella quateirensis TaxID=45072 RepID=A0ABR5RIX2_9GAMM|nr:hypothetical protein [Legionella quateirensis]KTD44715.1 hypothetical protein Lqua_2882 [Legionella quateirensis]
MQFICTEFCWLSQRLSVFHAYPTPIGMKPEHVLVVEGMKVNRPFRHPERSEGSPNAGTAPYSGDPSLHSG